MKTSEIRKKMNEIASDSAEYTALSLELERRNLPTPPRRPRSLMRSVEARGEHRRSQSSLSFRAWLRKSSIDPKACTPALAAKMKRPAR